MALTSIITPNQNNTVFYFNRGDIGVLEDIQAKGENEINLPQVVASSGGGNIFIMSE